MKVLTLDSIKEDYENLKPKDFFLKHVNRFDYFLQQIEWEWEEFMRWCSNQTIHYGMEIGTWGGGTFSTLTHLAEKDATLITLDLHEGMYKSLEDKEAALKILAKGDQTIHVKNHDSHDPICQQWIKEIIGDNELDYLFIDGDHSYDGVKDDFYMYMPFVKEGGLIAFHDIQPHTKGAEVDVFWREIKGLYKHIEIVESPESQTWAGIGVIWK